MSEHFQYIFCLRFSGFNLKMVKERETELRQLCEHLEQFLQNQRIVKDYMLLKPVAVKLSDENYEDSQEVGEYDYYTIYDETQPSDFWNLPAPSARAYRFIIFFGVDFQRMTAKSIIRFVYHTTLVLKRYFPNQYCSLGVWRTPLCPFNTSGSNEGGPLQNNFVPTRFIKNIYNSNQNGDGSSKEFDETNFIPFRRMLCFVNPDLTLDIINELANTLPAYDEHKKSLLDLALASWLEFHGCSPRQKSKKVPQTAAMKRVFS